MTINTVDITMQALVGGGLEHIPDAAAFCSTQATATCNDFTGIPDGTVVTDSQQGLFFDITSTKGSFIKEATGGYTNLNYTDSGTIKIEIDDGIEQGVSFGVPNSAHTLDDAEEVYCGAMIWVSSDMLQAMNAEEWKHFAGETYDGISFGTRQVLFMTAIDDTRSDVPSSLANYNAGSTGSYYWIPALAQEANATGVTDEAGNVGWAAISAHYTGGGEHGFKWNDYVDQWVYVEVRFCTVDSSNTSQELYIYTQDGNYRGAEYPANSADTPMIAVTSIADHAADGPWWYFTPHYYTELTAGTSADTFYKVDSLRLSSTFMGPPEGFI